LFRRYATSGLRVATDANVVCRENHSKRKLERINLIMSLQFTLMKINYRPTCKFGFHLINAWVQSNN